MRLRPPQELPWTASETQMHLTHIWAKVLIYEMLSVAKLTPGQETYYERSVAAGIDDYYAGRGESPGVWVGYGAAADLGLEGASQTKASLER